MSPSRPASPPPSEDLALGVGAACGCEGVCVEPGASVPRWQRWLADRRTTWVMWGLLFAGGVATEPAQSVLWTLACALASVRAFSFALRSRALAHWAIGGAFATGAVSIPLAALEVADVPWWYAAFAATGLVAIGAVRRVRARSSA